MLIVLVGAFLDVIADGALCAAIFAEIADDISRKLRRMQVQLGNIEAELNLAIATRHAELSACLQACHPSPAGTSTADKRPRAWPGST